MKFRNIRVKKAGGGYRTQRAMVLASGKLKFVKNTHGGSHSPGKSKAMAKRSSSKALTRRTKRRHHVAKMPRRTRRRGGGGGMNLTHLAGATLALGYLTGAASPIAAIPATAAKIPGAKTFGAPAVVGISALAIDRFVKPNRWLKLLGAAGIVLAAAKVGDQGSKFQWVGDDDDDVTADIGDDIEDVGDDDDMD